MKVWIVAKLRGNPYFSVHALTENNQNIRLSSKDNNPRTLSSFNIGDIWDLDIDSELPDQSRPYTENRIVSSHQYIGKQDHLQKFLMDRISKWDGSIYQAFDGRLQQGNNNALFANNWGNVLPISTGYWLPDKTLTMEKPLGSLQQPFLRKYLYADVPIDYTSFTAAITEIPAYTLIYLSLKAPWAVKEKQIYNNPSLNKVAPKRSYLEIGGWFL